MQKRIIEGVEVQRSSGNVFADLGLPDAEKLKIKTGLVVEIRRAMRALGLTQQAAAKRMGHPATEGVGYYARRLHQSHPNAKRWIV